MANNQEEIIKRVEVEAYFMIKTGNTVREIAEVTNVSKSTVHIDLTKRLEKYYPGLVEQINAILKQHKKDRSIRGGQATRKKYLKMKNKK